ncbi:HNH endonuclease signature motif containing protein [uncultured Serinicoccus sp.]|uniref:HNH endonuclease signature motif containing protein n=1 Tax=uncultured Serinicoccus sp. TaxID=735514 RepID=UPI00260206E4|nr:HNH endonuclease signature motif containing protein [uncultured Serinicoccus sp.]
MTGMNPASVDAMAQAALAVGAVDSGSPLGSAAVLDTPPSPVPTPQTPHLAGPAASGTAEPSTGTVTPISSVDDHLARAHGLLSVIEGVTQTAARLDAALVLAARHQTAAIGRSLLAERDVSSPEDLSTHQRLRWRARAKALSRHEIEAATGWGAGEVVDLVGLATAPREAAQPAIDAMATGVAPWRLTRSFWRDCGALGTDEAAHVAEVLFGADAESCAPERLDPDGALSEAPWFHREFRAALRREVTRVRSTDLVAARAEREAALAGRSMGVTIDENGTGTVTLLGSALQATAIADRIDQAARRARAGGDERTLPQLRADIGLSLMLHGTATPPDTTAPRPPRPLPGSAPESSPPEDTTTAGLRWTPDLAQVLSGMPSATLQVVVPYAAVHGDPRLTSTASHEHAPAPPGPPVAPPGPPVAPPGPPVAPAGPPVEPPGPPVALPDTTSTDDLLTVGQVLGAHSAYISADQIHDLTVLPGTVLERLLVDPADGRCIERSLERYRPDAAMRAQILAADVTCRAPGCLVHAGACQLDHVIEHGAAGGVTAETNLVPLHVGHHHPKTLKAWDSSLGENRDMTWTSLLGRLYRTRSHDYRQYVHRVTDALDRVHAASTADPADRLPQIDREILLTLAFRAAGEGLQAGDDTVEPDEGRFGGWGFVSLTHTDDRGMRRSGPSGALLAERAAAQAASQFSSDGSAPQGQTSHPLPGRSSDPSQELTSGPSPDRVSDPPRDRRDRSAERLRRDEGPPPF